MQAGPAVAPGPGHDHADENQAEVGGLVDELRLHIVPFTLGAGARLFDGIPGLDLEQVRARAASTVTHVTYRLPPGRPHSAER
jgi:dihydrofolate reductase